MNHRGRKRAGITLAELLVWAMLSLIVLGIGGTMLWQIFRTTTRGSAIAQLEQTGSTAMSRLIAELQRTTAKGITIHYELDWNGTKYNCTAIQTLQSVDGQGRSTYADYKGLILYSWTPGVTVLRRREWPHNSPGVTLSQSDPERLTPDQVRTLLADTQAVELRVPDVTNFRVYAPDVPAPNVGSHLELKIETRRRVVPNRPEESFALERVIVLRNSL